MNKIQLCLHINLENSNLQHLFDNKRVHYKVLCYLPSLGAAIKRRSMSNPCDITIIRFNIQREKTENMNFTCLPFFFPFCDFGFPREESSNKTTRRHTRTSLILPQYQRYLSAANVPRGIQLHSKPRNINHKLDRN